MAPPPPPPSGLDVDLTHDGFRCALKSRKNDASPWMATADEMAQLAGWAAVFGLSLVVGVWASGIFQPTSGLDLMLRLLKLSVFLVSFPIVYVLFEHVVLRRRWKLSVDADAVTLTPIVLGRAMPASKLALEGVRSVEVTGGGPRQLRIRSSCGRFTLDSSHDRAELQWLRDAIRYARSRKAEFWRDEIGTDRSHNRRALTELTQKM